MTEKEGLEVISREIGFCYGPDRILSAPTETSGTVFSNGEYQLTCPDLTRGAICNLTETPCAVLAAKGIVFNKEKEDPVIVYTTEAGTLVFDTDRQEVLLSPLLEEGHDPIKLPSFQAVILETLLRAEGRLCTKEELYTAKNGSAEFVDLTTVTVQVSSLRNALGQYEKNLTNNDEKIIQTTRSKGYAIRKPRR